MKKALTASSTLATAIAIIMYSSLSAAAGAPKFTPSLEGWTQVGGTDRSFVVRRGILRLERSGDEPAALLTEADFENFELTCEFNVSHWCESGLYIHAPRNGAFRAGLEIELGDHSKSLPSPYVTGAIFRLRPPKEVAVRPYGKWNSLHLKIDWPRLQVTINDRLVQDLDLSQDEDLKYKLRRGAIGFQNLGFGLRVKNLEVTPLPDTEGGLDLFNGHDLAGWFELRHVAARWNPHDGIITASTGNGYLAHETLVQDFDLRMYIRTSSAANGGVFFRWLPDDSDRGNEIQILDDPYSAMPTGSIYGIVRADTLPLTPRHWELLQISLRGPHCVTHINGVKVAETKSLTKIRPGHIVLQMHKTDATIDFKDIVLVPADED